MINLKVFVAHLISYLCLVIATTALADDDKKVKVGSLSTQQQEQVLVPQFSNLEQLLEYKTNWLATQPENVLQAFEQFQMSLPEPLYSKSSENKNNSSPNSVKSQQAEFKIALSDVHLALNDLKTAYQQLDNLTLSSLSVSLQITILENKANILKLQHKIHDAITQLKQAHNLAIEHKLTQQSVFTALQLSDAYLTVQQIEQTHYWQQQATQLLAQQNDLATEIEASIVLAKQQQQLGEYLQATQTLFKVIDKVAKNNYYAIEMSLRRQLSDNFKTAKQYLNAEQELEKAYKLSVKVRNKQQQLLVLIQLMQTYLAQNKIEDANELLTASEPLSRYLSSQQDKRELLLIKAKVQAGLLNYSKALQLLNKINTDDIIDAQSKVGLEIELLQRKVQWQIQTQQASIETFEQLVQTKLLQQQSQSEIKAGYLSDHYQYKIEQLKQQLAEHTKRNNSVKQHNNALADSVFYYQVLLLFIFVLVLAASYYVKSKLNKHRAERRFLDPITGAHNHSYFVKHVGLLINHKTPFSLVMFDVDNMRKINNSLGHELGDRLLTMLVKRLETRLGSNKLLVRLSGDHFIVIAKNFSLNQAFALAEILRKELNSNKFYLDKLSVNLSASFGVTSHHGNKGIDALKDEVQDALDKAKTTGGNVTKVVGFY